MVLPPNIENDRAYEMTPPRLSLIIPVYNGRAYIDSLIDEIISQNFSGLEVWFIDDGSVDGSGEVIEARITQQLDIGSQEIQWHLYRQKNQGQGGARNTGMRLATGQWIAFMDQDDHIRNGYLETLMDEAQGQNCDVLISGYDCVQPDGLVTLHVALEDTSWSRFMNVTPWGKVFRREFIEKRGIRFYETPYGEDIYFTLMVEAARARVHISSYVGYCWVQNQNSVSHTMHRYLNPEASALSLLRKAASDIHGLDTSDDEVCYFFLKTAIYHVLYIAPGTEHRTLLLYNQELFAYLRNAFPMILTNPLIGRHSPRGERGTVCKSVAIYAFLVRTHLDGLFLSVYGTISAIRGRHRL